MSDQKPQHVAQTQNSYQTTLLPRRSPIDSSRYVLWFDNDESVTTSFSNVGEDGRESVGWSTSHDSSEIGRTLIDRVFDRRVEYLISVLSNEILYPLNSISVFPLGESKSDRAYDDIHSLVHIQHDSILIDDRYRTDSTFRKDMYDIKNASFHRRSRQRKEPIRNSHRSR